VRTVPEPVRRHHWIVRVTHWVAFLLVFGMIASGLQIYRAYARFGDRGATPYPNPFQDVVFPEWSRLGGWLAGGINWHFALMWPLVGVGLLYLGYLAFSGEWRKLLFRPRDVRGAIEVGSTTSASGRTTHPRASTTHSRRPPTRRSCCWACCRC
jgi:thiosulfate reductase cytochrome b subunit